MCCQPSMSWGFWWEGGKTPTKYLKHLDQLKIDLNLVYQTLFCSFLKNTETLFNSKQWQSKPLYLYERNESDLYYPLTIYKDDRSSRLNVLQNFLLKPATLLKLALLHGCFSIFLNSTNGTKSDKASHMYLYMYHFPLTI